MLKISNVAVYLGYMVSGITFVFGAVIISGWAFLYVPRQLRIMFGIVLMLWGVYRFVLTRSRSRQQNDESGDA
jgi:hypothetical protein